MPEDNPKRTWAGRNPVVRQPPAAHHRFISAAKTTLLHFLTSSEISLAKSAGDPPRAVPPRPASRAWNFGSAMLTLTSIEGSHSLKGFAESVRLFAADGSGAKRMFCERVCQLIWKKPSTLLCPISRLALKRSALSLSLSAQMIAHCATAPSRKTVVLSRHQVTVRREAVHIWKSRVDLRP